MARLSGPSRSALQIKSRLSPAFERRQFIEPQLFEAASAALTADAIYFTSKTTSTGS